MDKKHVKNLQWEFEKTMNFSDSDFPNSDWSEKITSDWLEMASSDEPDPFDYINTKLNLFQVIQLYLINDIYENHEGIYSTLYNIINDIKLSINLKELNQTLNGYVSTAKNVTVLFGQGMQETPLGSLCHSLWPIDYRGTASQYDAWSRVEPH